MIRVKFKPVYHMGAQPPFCYTRKAQRLARNRQPSPLFSHARTKIDSGSAR
jgi:hypothetical protein